jgi:hypothetical protein
VWPKLIVLVGINTIGTPRAFGLAADLGLFRNRDDD